MLPLRSKAISEAQVKGTEVFQWLSQAEQSEWPALIGCLVDDGSSETAWIITAIGSQILDVAREGNQRATRTRPWAWIRSHIIVVPPSCRSIIALIMQIRPPYVVALDQAKQRLRDFGFDPERIASTADLERLDSVLGLSTARNAVPSDADRWAVFQVVQRVGQGRAALRHFQSWQNAVEDGHGYDALGRLHIALLLRHSGRLKEALEASAVLDGPSRCAPGTERFVGHLSCTRAASMLDVFESDGNVARLAEAKRHLDRAYATDQSEEVKAVYGRLRRLQELLDRENPLGRTPLGPRRNGG